MTITSLEEVFLKCGGDHDLDDFAAEAERLSGRLSGLHAAAAGAGAGAGAGGRPAAGEVRVAEAWLGTYDALSGGAGAGGEPQLWIQVRWSRGGHGRSLPGEGGGGG